MRQASLSQVTKQPIKLPNMKYNAFASCHHRTRPFVQCMNYEYIETSGMAYDVMINTQVIIIIIYYYDDATRSLAKQAKHRIFTKTFSSGKVQ